MRLLNVYTFEFVEVYRIPENYAVASHRWSVGNEAMLSDMKNGYRRDTSGYKKVLGFAEYIKENFPNISLLWIDTCCINQDSDREVSEAVNSMFRWYANAEVCLAYLSDVANPRDIQQLRRSEWFSRGWTLQELLAPKTVIFLSQLWEAIGHKGPNRTRCGTMLRYGNWPLEDKLAEITGIPQAVLCDHSTIASYDISTRLTWMEGRETTREEDIVYCMFGIFDVVLPILYGETAERARQRLLKETSRNEEHWAAHTRSDKSAYYRQTSPLGSHGVDAKPNKANSNLSHRKQVKRTFDANEVARRVRLAVSGSPSIPPPPSAGRDTTVRSRNDGARAKSKNLTTVGKEMSGLTIESSLTPYSNVSLKTRSPQWNRAGWLDKKMDMEGFCPALFVHDSSTLNDMMAGDENIKMSLVELSLSARSVPFAEGSRRRASYARTAASDNYFVVKSFKKAGHGDAEMAEDMRIQALCKAFALEFNGLLKIEPPLDFIVISSLQSKSTSKPGAENTCLLLEPYIPGEYIKYNSNGGFVNQSDDSFNQLAQAFSHFTFERSWGHLLVNELQGVDHLLIDPCIQTRDKERFKLSDTNLNEDGFKFFFAYHECNDFCEVLELKSSKWSFASGNMQFRELWPTMDPAVCCSNKLCRRIIRQADSYASDKYPSHHWCDKCWPQLESYTVSWICIEPGPTHEFELSRFYFESQGQLTPRKCDKHREKDLIASGGAAVGRGL
jgi:hypothetical protein